MNDAALVGGLQRERDLTHDGDRVGPRPAPAGVEVAAQRRADEQFHRDPQDAVVVAGVDAAQKDLARHVEGDVIVQQNTTFHLQRAKLNEATDALAKGNFVGCAIAAQVALEGEKTAKLVLDAKWLIAQCSLLARDTSTARDALQDFKDNANIADKRFEPAKTQLRALERGEVPPGLRTW